MEHFINNIKRYADFKGRARRQEYWMYMLFYLIFAFVLGIVEAALGLSFIGTLYILILFLPTISICARRLHDTGRSGWWQLLNIIPIIGPIVILVFTVLDGDENENKWGVNPKQAEQA